MAIRTREQLEALVDKEKAVKREEKRQRQFERRSKKSLALRMANDKTLRGSTNAELAEKYRVSITSVSKILSLVDETELIKRAKALGAERLVYKALAVYESALDAGDTEIATKVLEGYRVLNPKGASVLDPANDANIESLEIYRLRRKAASLDQAGAESGGTPRGLPVVEGALSDGPAEGAQGAESPSDERTLGETDPGDDQS